MPDDTTIRIGTPLRDAAVDPDAGDYLAPIGAGQEDPHGRMVVAPGLVGRPHRHPAESLTTAEAYDQLRARFPHLDI